MMEKFKKYQVLASLFVALFVVNFSFVLTCMNKRVFNSIEYSYQPSKEDELNGYELSDFQAEIIYSQLVDGFTSFFDDGYEIAGYKLSQPNTDKLNQLKGYYRLAYFISIACVIGIFVCFSFLSRRRELKPIAYGSALAFFLLAVSVLFVFLSKKGTALAVKNMILKKDYSFFSREDVLGVLFTGNYALYMLFCQVVTALILVLIINAVRAMIIYMGRPHKF